jgi:two-component system sensor histidine kinase DesK
VNSTVTDAPFERIKGRVLSGWLLAGVWLVYLANPLQRMLHHSHGAVRVVGIVALALFCVGYMTFFTMVRRARVDGEEMSLWVRAGYPAVLLVLAGFMVPAAGEKALNTLVYITAMAMMALPLRYSAAVAATLLATTEIALRVVPGWHEDGGYGLAIVLGALAVFGLRRAMQRSWELAETRKDFAELRVQEERTRFARDLHDILGHSLTVITVKAELAGKLVTSQSERAAAEVADIEKLARAALADVRAAVAGYRELSLAGELVSARTALQAAGITPVLPTAVDQVPEDRRELFAWVVREGVTNVVRHSNARRCTVVLDAAGVEVVDDGPGPSVSKPGGHGLVGLRERAAAAGAALQVGRRPEGGFRLALRMAS